LVRLRQADDSQPAEVAEEAPKARQVAASQRLRADVYTAFKDEKCYAFDRRTSGFYAVDPTYDVGGDENLIAVDAVELESLLKDRRDFAETLPEPLQEFAKAALAGEHPMTAFKTLLITHRSFEQWIVFHNQLLISRLRRWAERVGVGFSPTWLEGDAIAAKDNRFREAIENIITLMPDEELGEIQFLLNISGSFFHSKSVPTLILAGIPNRVFRRHDGEDPSIQLNGWNLELFPALQDAASVSKCWAAVLERIAQLDVNNDHDGIHVLLLKRRACLQ
jgi:hypothetical protein